MAEPHKRKTKTIPNHLQSSYHTWMWVNIIYDCAAVYLSLMSTHDPCNYKTLFDNFLPLLCLTMRNTGTTPCLELLYMWQKMFEVCRLYLFYREHDMFGSPRGWEWTQCWSSSQFYDSVNASNPVHCRYTVYLPMIPRPSGRVTAQVLLGKHLHCVVDACKQQHVAYNTITAREWYNAHMIWWSWMNKANNRFISRFHNSGRHLCWNVPLWHPWNESSEIHIAGLPWFSDHQWNDDICLWRAYDCLPIK